MRAARLLSPWLKPGALRRELVSVSISTRHTLHVLHVYVCTAIIPEGGMHRNNGESHGRRYRHANTRESTSQDASRTVRARWLGEKHVRFTTFRPDHHCVIRSLSRAYL